MNDPATADVLAQLCAACVDLLDVSGAGISLMTHADGGGIVAASSDLAAQVEEWQFSLSEGPCKQAFTSGRPIMVGQVAPDRSGHASHWPVFADRIRQAGIQAIFAFPLQRAGSTVGVLDVYRDRAGLLNSEQVGVASAFADLAGTLLPIVAGADDVDYEPVYRFQVHQATGMITAQLDVTTVEALVRLRGRAFAEGRTVSELAADVVARRVRFSKEDR